MDDQSLVGKTVEVPTDYASSVIGEIVSARADGLIVVEDEEGELWKGWEYQAQLIKEEPNGT